MVTFHVRQRRSKVGFLLRQCGHQLLALVVPRFGPPRELPTGSTADASFEATGDLSTWPLSLRGISLCELAITLTGFRSELRRR